MSFQKATLFFVFQEITTKWNRDARLKYDESSLKLNKNLELVKWNRTYKLNAKSMIFLFKSIGRELLFKNTF